MAFPEAKVYFDGSHYIAIPHTKRRLKPRRIRHEELIEVKEKPETTVKAEEKEGTYQREVSDILKTESKEEKNELQTERKPEVIRTTTKKAVFEELYENSRDMSNKHARRNYIVNEMLQYFDTRKETKAYVQEQLERKLRNLIVRRTRLWRKINLQEFNYFCTFTYDDKKHDEESFRKKLRTCLRNCCHRRGWKYIGVWERSPEKKRLHFHGLFYIPDNGLIGELFEVEDYNLRTKRKQKTIQNSYFNERFGRSDFEPIDTRRELGEMMAYIIKYIEKTGEKIVYSKGLPQYFISDIMDDDVACRIGLEDKKLLLFDDFDCWDEGEYMGKVSLETISRMRKAN